MAALLTVFYGLLVAFFSVIAGSFLYVVGLLFYVHNKYDHLPGPKRTSFFMGNMPELRHGTRTPAECVKRPELSNNNNKGEVTKLKPMSWEKFIDWAEIYGDTYVLYIMHRALIITRCPNMIKTMLVNADQKIFPKTDTIRVRELFGARYMCDGLATAINHDAWYLRRKVLDPVFHRNQLKRAVDTFNFTGDSFIHELQEHADSGESFYLSPMLHRTTLDVIFRTMFSLETGSLGTEFHEQAFQFVDKTFEAVQMGAIPFIDYNPMFRTYRKEIRKICKDFREIGSQIIRDRLKLVQEGEQVPEDMLTTMTRAHLDPTTGYTFDIMVDEFITMIVAGMETSATTLSFIFMELGRRPDLMTRLKEEVDDVVGNKHVISNDDITKLSFTTTLIKESLRLYHPATGIVREVAEETTVDGLRLPVGSFIIVSIAGANKNKRFIDNPMDFNPDRFSPAAEKRVPMYSFISFSLGSRNCIGQVFAQMEMKVMLAKFVQHFNFIIDDSETFELGQKATIFPISGLKCKVTPRSAS